MMRSVLALIALSFITSPNVNAGDDLEQACAALSEKHDHGPTTLYKGAKIVDVMSAKFSTAGGATFKIGGGELGDNYWHYTVRSNDPWTYDVAKMAYVTGVNVDICVAQSTLDNNIDELVGVRLAESTPSMISEPVRR